MRCCTPSVAGRTRTSLLPARFVLLTRLTLRLVRQAREAARRSRCPCRARR
jgi:hypothetical protein